MTISSVSSSPSQAFVSEVDSYDGSITGLAGELAVLMLERAEQQKTLQRDQLSLARQEYEDALNAEVEALKEQADATFRGAALQAGLSVAGSGASLWGLAREQENTWQERLGAGLGSLAAPLGTAFSRTYAAADAKSAEGEQTAAKWQLDDAKKELDDAKANQDKALEWLGSVVDRDAATMTAILANKV